MEGGRGWGGGGGWGWVVRGSEGGRREEGALVGRDRKEKVEEAGSWRRRGEKVRERDLERENKGGNEKQETWGLRRLKKLFIGLFLSIIIFLNHC